MNRREFIKAMFSVAVVSLCPVKEIPCLASYSELHVNYREQAKAQLAKWLQDEMDKQIFKYLIGETPEL